MVMIYGHRGARGEAPENTVTGFSYARKLGVHAFELDVHLPADDQLVVIHDPTVDRTTNRTGPVNAFTAEELAGLDARSAFPDWLEPAGVPRLREVLDVIAGATRLEIEIKTDKPERLERVATLLLEILETYDITRRTVITSFDPIALEIVQWMAPLQQRGLIARYSDRSDVDTAARLGCMQANIPLMTGSRAMVEAAHAEGLIVVGWQGNTPEDLGTLLNWEADIICTDYPSMALSLLQDRTAGEDVGQYGNVRPGPASALSRFAQGDRNR